MTTSRARTLGVLVISVVAALALSSCANGGGASGEEDSGGIDIAMLAYTDSGFPQAFAKGAESIVSPDGGSVTILSAEFDPQAQVEQCEDAITSGRYDALLIIPLEPSLMVPCVSAANAAGIPVATAETAIGDDPYSTTPQLDGIVAVAATTLSGQADADIELITQACGDAAPCKIIAEVATPTDRWTNDLVTAIGDGLADDAEIVGTLQSYYDPGEVARSLPDMLTANPDLSVFFAVSDDSALAAIRVIDEAGLSDQIKVIGLGGSAEGAAAVTDGTLFATTGTWPLQVGELLATALVEAVSGEKVTQAEIDMLTVDEPVLITSETVGSFTPEWGSSQ